VTFRPRRRSLAECGLSWRVLSAHELTVPSSAPALPALELIWQEDATAYAIARSDDGSLSAGHLHLGMPAIADLDELGPAVAARRVGVGELIALAADPPAGMELGGSALVTLAVVELAQRSVSEGLVHPQVEQNGDQWFAFWGATLDPSVQDSLRELAAALPPVCANAFGGDRAEAVRDLYACVVDQVARDRIAAAKVRLGGASAFGRPSAADAFLAALTGAEPALAPHRGTPAFASKLTRWVDEGLGRRSSAPWTIALRLDERETAGRATSFALELWLQATDDPTLALPASLLWAGADEVFAFLRTSDPRRALVRKLDEVEPLLAAAGIRFAEVEPSEAGLDADAVRFFLREALPRLEELGVPVLLPSTWLAASNGLRVNLTARSGRQPGAHSTGLLSTSTLASFDWQLAVGGVVLSEDEIAELVSAEHPFVWAGGRWHALRKSEVEKALRFLERRRGGVGIVELVRAVSGLETEEAGLELGEVELDEALAGLLRGDEERRFEPLTAPATMQLPLFPFQERGHGWLRMLGDLGIGAILADDMGLGKTVQAIAMLLSEREQPGGDELGPTLVVCPMGIARQWTKEIARFGPSLRVHLHHGKDRLAGEALAAAARASDVVVTSYDIVTRDVDDLAEIRWDRLLLDEAQDVKNPATKRARALRCLPARRRMAMTGTPIENRLSELWALMDIVNPGLLGSRQRFERSFARPIEAWSDEQALARLRAMVQPFILRRPKDAPEVEMELPPITVVKDYCRLTREQASLYRATIDRWLPQIARHEDRFGRRGAVLAMLGRLKQVCNHPEMVVATGQPLAGRSGKLERLVELLEAVPKGDKALVFTQYPGFDRLVSHLEERLGKQVGFFHGRLSAHQREELVDAFTVDDDLSLLVISIRAGGRGLNLPAANHVFHFDRWWNPAVEQQATDRVHRFGQHKEVHVHSLICRATLEERIDALLESKRELAEKVIAARSEDWLGDLDLDAIRAAVELAPDDEESF
jgi:hypothetical protein